jgi:DNA end-binding protein Ku
MPSAVWAGHLHFGLVVIPVRLLVAARTKTTRFRRLHRKPLNQGPSLTPFSTFPHDRDDNNSELIEEAGESRSNFAEEINDRNTAQHQYSTVRQVLQSEETGQEISHDEVVKGYEIAKNEFTAIDPQEIKAAEIETSDTIDLFHFVKAATVDPIYFERSYYVAPDTPSAKAYSLLLEAMRREECLGIARIGMHRREHMLILRPSEDYLVAHTMFYANEVRPAPHSELTTEFSNKELSMATTLVKAYEGEFDPTQFKDVYQERIRKIIDAKVSSHLETYPAATSRVRDVPDLMDQLRSSLAQIEAKKADVKPLKKPVRKTPTQAKKKPERIRA